MSAPRLELVPTTPWFLRVFDRLPLAAFWVGAGFGLLVFAVFLLYTAVFGEGPGRLAGTRLGFGWAAELHQDLFFGLTLALAAASIRGALRDFEALRPALDAGARSAEALRGEMLRWWPRPLHAFALCFGLFPAFATPMDAAMWDAAGFPGFAHPTALWLAARNFANWWAVGFAAGLELMLGLGFSRLAGHLGQIDLLDRRVLEPFGRRAVRSVSLWMLLAAFLSVIYAGQGWAGALLPLGLLNLTAFATAAFLLPLRGARRLLRERKGAELASLRAAIGTAREKALASPEASGGRLADLLAWEARVEAVREWPIETSNLVRLGLYVAIGLGSWLGAALVDELLGRLLR